MNKPITKKEWMEYLEKTWDAAQEEALAQPEQEPVAWLHTKIEGVAVPHRPADLDKHPDRWEALYRTPPPCPTCEALARTVMLDQTYHDNIAPQRTWVGLTNDEVNNLAAGCHLGNSVQGAIYKAEANLKEKNT